MEAVPPLLKVTPKSTKRKSYLIQTTKSRIPNCKKLYQEYFISRQLGFRRRARRAINFNKSLKQLMDKYSPLAKKKMWKQINQYTKRPKDEEFTEDEKLIGLTIMKRYPKYYKFLQRIFMLPSKTVLKKMPTDLNIEVVDNQQIIAAIKEKVEPWSSRKKYCTIIFDQVPLKGNKKLNDFADHALVFIVRGALHKWLQPIAFYCSQGVISGMKLKHIIKDVVSSVDDVGLKPLALVCNQNKAFCSALKSLKEDTRKQQSRAGGRIEDVIKIKEHTLSVIYDRHHLLKGLRNNFIKRNMKYEDKICRWSDIVDVYRSDFKIGPSRMLHELNDNDVFPDKIKKSKVGRCCNVFSQVVAALLFFTSTMGKYCNGTEVSSTLKNTAKMIDFMYYWLDSANGDTIMHILSKRARRKHLYTAITSETAHHEFWKEAIIKIKKIRFVDDKGKETIVPTLKNFVTTIESYQRLWRFFKTKNIRYMYTSYLNCDPTKVFFDQLSFYNVRSCYSFKWILKPLLTDPLLFLCVDVTGKQLHTLDAILKRGDIQVEWPATVTRVVTARRKT